MRPNGSSYDSPTREGGVKWNMNLSPSWGGLWPRFMDPEKNVLRITHGTG